MLVDVNKGLISWGVDKCFFNIRLLVEGVKSENVRVDYYDDDMFEISNWHTVKNNAVILQGYEEYINSQHFQTVIKRGDNLPRFMLTDCTKNHNKNKEMVMLHLKRT